VIKLQEEDLEITSGDTPSQGGQRATRPSGAVRIKHLPTGIEVVSRAHRSRLGNKAAALRMLSAAIEASEEKPVAIKWLPTSEEANIGEMSYFEASVGICSLNVWRTAPIKEWQYEVEINAQSLEKGWAASADEAKNKCRDAVVQLVVQIQGDL
jgi:RF-1 domain